MNRKKKEINVKRERSKESEKKSFFEMKAFRYVAILFFIISGFAIYYRTLDYPFQFDDLPLIKNNNVLTKSYPEFHILKKYPLRFVSFYSFYLNYDQSGPKPEDFRIWNIIIHILNTILVFILLQLILKTPGLNNKFTLKTKHLISFIIALIFLVHPMQTQAVIYIYQRLASLVGLFYFSAAVFYLAGRLSRRLIFRLLFFAITAFVTLLGMLTKENSFTIPLMLVMLELILFKASFKSSWKIIAGAFVFGALGLYLFFYFGIDTQLLYTRYDFSGRKITSWNYFLTQWSVLIEYMRMMILPYGQNADHQYFLSSGIFEIRTLLSGLFHLGMIFTAFYFLKRHKLVTIGIVWFYVAISIESSFIPIRDVIFEHRVYIPLIGFFMAITGLLHYFLSEKQFTKYAVPIFVVFAGIMSVATINRSEVWSDPVKLWTDVIKKSPDKSRPYNNRGDTYFRMGKMDLALQDFNKAVENLQPTIKKMKGEEAPRWYLDEIANPIKNRALAKYNMGKVYEAIEDFSTYLEINYKDHSVYNDRANAYKITKQYEKAIADYTKYLNKTSKNFEYYDIVIKNLGICYMQLGKHNKAIEDFTQAIKLNPDEKQHYLHRAFSYYKLEKYKLAKQDYKKILEIDPNSKDAKKNIRVINNLMAK